MTLEIEDRGVRSAVEYQEVESTPFSSWDTSHDRWPLEDAGHGQIQLRAPIPRNRAPSGPQNEVLTPQREDQPVERVDDTRHQQRPKSVLRRRPLASVSGLILLFVALSAGYFYWDYTSHFESTDDAFIAARQFTIAPKVAGYHTAVPVTDNQHVAAGQVIARIDERDYRNALAVAQAQEAAAQASIDTIEGHRQLVVDGIAEGAMG